MTLFFGVMVFYPFMVVAEALVEFLERVGER